MMAVAPSQRLPIVASAAFCLVFCLAGWWFYTGIRIIFAQDWMVFDTASAVALRGDYALLADGARFTGLLASRFHDVLRWPINPHPWVYPPPFLLMVLPLALVGSVPAYVLFLTTGFLGLLIAIGLLPVPRWQRAVLMISAAACPGTLFTVLVGQNAFLSAALLVAGIALLDRRPLVAGALLGLLVFKPQLAVLLPVALLAGRSWRALAAAACSATLSCVASLAVFGPRVWIDWGRLLLGAGPDFRRWELAGRQNGISVYACAYAIGHSELIAGVVQDAAIVVAGLLIAHVFGGQRSRLLRASALLLAIGIGAPHLGGYDTLICGLGATMVWLHGMTEGFRPGEMLLCLLCWAMPLTFTPSVAGLAVLFPLTVLALLVCVAMRSRPVWELGGWRAVEGATSTAAAQL